MSVQNDYNEEIQKLLLDFMVSDHVAFSRSQNIIDPAFFNDKLRKPARFIKQYFEKYSKVPPVELVHAETGVKLNQLDHEILVNADNWYLETIEQFCRHKAMENTILLAPELIEKGMYGAVENQIKENMLISLNTDMGTDYFVNPQERLQRMRDRTGMTSTGWKDIDAKLYGGMNRGELTFFAGGPGTGKSLFLQNLALNWIQMGLNVVYVTLELSEELVGLRFDAMITETETKGIMKDIDTTAMKVALAHKGKRWGRLNIKKFPEAGTTANKIRAYLKEYEVKYKVKPDAICVDYLDLLHPNNMKVGASDMFVKDKYTSEELRALAAEYNLLAATASQLNRGSIQEQNFDASHMAGGISKINTADNVLAIYMSAQMREIGQYQIQFLKTRSSAGVGSHVFLRFNQSYLRIIDQEEGFVGGGNSNLSRITEELKNVSTKVQPSSAPSVETTEYKPSGAGPGANSGPSNSDLKQRMLNINKHSNL